MTSDFLKDMDLHVVRLLNVASKSNKGTKHISFNSFILLIVHSNIIPILGSHHTSPKEKMYKTSASTHAEYIQDIHIRQGHAQPDVLRALLTGECKWQPLYADLLKKVVND